MQVTKQRGIIKAFCIKQRGMYASFRTKQRGMPTLCSAERMSRAIDKAIAASCRYLRVNGE